MGPSEQVALKLARTTKYELGSTYVLSETGFAGPTVDLHLQHNSGDHKQESTGGDEDVANNPHVGVVYLGLNGPNVEVSCKRDTNNENRSENMTEFALLGLKFLLEQLENQKM